MARNPKDMDNNPEEIWAIESTYTPGKQGGPKGNPEKGSRSKNNGEKENNVKNGQNSQSQDEGQKQVDGELDKAQNPYDPTEVNEHAKGQNNNPNHPRNAQESPEGAEGQIGSPRGRHQDSNGNAEQEGLGVDEKDPYTDGHTKGWEKDPSGKQGVSNQQPGQNGNSHYPGQNGGAPGQGSTGGANPQMQGGDDTSGGTGASGTPRQSGNTSQQGGGKGGSSGSAGGRNGAGSQGSPGSPGAPGGGDGKSVANGVKGGMSGAGSTGSASNLGKGAGAATKGGMPGAGSAGNMAGSAAGAAGKGAVPRGKGWNPKAGAAASSLPMGGGVGGVGVPPSVANQMPGANSAMGEKAQRAQQMAQKAQQAAQKARRYGKQIAEAARGLVKLLANPYFWIAVAVILIILTIVVAIIVAHQTIGKNDASDGCYGVSANNSSTIVFNDDDDLETRMNKMATWLLEQPGWEFNDGKPMSKKQAFAIVGNFAAESGLDPGIIEYSAPNREQYLGADNDRVDQWTEENTYRGTYIGLGLAQWTWNYKEKGQGRAGNLIDKARETGTQWYEIQPQLELMQEEMNSESYAPRLKASGFTDDSSQSTGELAVTFHDVYEGSADDGDMVSRRSKFAEQAEKAYVGGSTTGGKTNNAASGGSCTKGGDNLDMSNSIKLALSIAWGLDEHGRSGSGGGQGKEQAKPEYIKAKEAAMEGNADGLPDLYASCDRVVATIIKNTVDKDFPWGPVSEIQRYLDENDDWEKVPLEQREPGDILINSGRGQSHVAFYVGEYDGQEDVTVEGSYMDYVARVNNDKWSINTPGFWCYRYKGEPDRTDTSLIE